jgi:hypothetical protein
LLAIVLLSDANLADQTFKEEFNSVLRSQKGILPILLPDMGVATDLGISLGWTGSVGDDFWKHAEGKGHSEVLVKYLGHFKPCQYPLALSSEDPSKKDLHDFAAVVTSRIHTSIQRDGKLSTYTDMSLLGVRLSFLTLFIENNGGEDRFRGLTTKDVMIRLVLPETMSTGLSFCELMLSRGLKENVGDAEWFLSHAWTYLFLDVVSALRSHFNDTDPVIWYDLFSVSQHKTAIRTFDWWNTTFMRVIAAIGQILILVQPFDDPVTTLSAWVTLKRIWCIFEIYAGEVTSARFEAIMTAPMKTRFLALLDSDPASVVSVLESINSSRAEASDEEDRIQVSQVISRTTGFCLLDTTVMRVMERWLYATLLAARKSDALHVMEYVCDKCVAIRERKIGLRHPDTTNSRRILGVIQKAQADAGFRQMLVEKGWVAYEQEELQNTERAKRLEEERMRKQEAEEIARLAEASAAEEKWRIEKAAEEEKRRIEEEEEADRRLGAMLATSQPAKQAANKPRCCIIS